jgi:hypothetical protein
MIASNDIKQSKFPTLDSLGAKVPSPLDAGAITAQWFKSFAQAMQTADVLGVAAQLLPGVFWRDLLALTWDFRTFYADGVPTFLHDRLASSKISHIALDENSAQLQQPYPDVAWIHLSFTFRTGLGACSGIARLMPTAGGAWQAHTVFTNLEDLLGHPERIGALREQEASHGLWREKRRREVECEGPNEQPAVVIFGAGQSGLEARVPRCAKRKLSLTRESRWPRA